MRLLFKEFYCFSTGKRLAINININTYMYISTIIGFVVDIIIPVSN